MKALVIGATGFIGFHVSRQLLRDGYQVRALVRRSSNRRRLVGGVEPVVGELGDSESVARCVDGCQWVFHAGGRVSFWVADAPELERQHLVGTMNVASACLRAGARLIYTSSFIAVGPPEPDGTVGDEETPFRWDRKTFPYAGLKHEAGKRVMGAAREGLDAVVVMPATTFGPFDFNLSAARFISDFDAGRILGYPVGGMTVAHAEAVAEGHVKAALLGRTGEAYILGGDHLSYEQLFRVIGRGLGRRPPRFAVPSVVMRLLGIGGSTASRLFRRDFGLNRTTAMLGCVRLYFTSAKAEREIGYRSLPAEDAIEKACRWYMKQASCLVPVTNGWSDGS